MRNSALFLASTASVLYFTTAAIADELGRDITIEQASKMLHYSGGNDRMRVEVAPNYSEELGFSLKGVAGGYLTDELALGLIVEYGENKREYLANAGIQFSDELSFVGTVGMLEEHHEYVDGDGRKMVQQMEYGGSLKGAYDVGILSGFELNGYLTNADAGSDTVETGDLYGVQLLADIDLTDTTHLKLGGGYEWLEWADGDNNDSFAFSAEGVQRLGTCSASMPMPPSAPLRTSMVAVLSLISAAMVSTQTSLGLATTILTAKTASRMISELS